MVQEIVDRVQSIVKGWKKQILTVIIQSHQLRKENDKVGPMIELEYWRRQLAKFMSIIEHIRSQECKMYIQLLIQARSKIIKKWKEMDNEITISSNEAQDIVKYLYALETFCEPLYRNDPTKIPDFIPSLLYSIRMVFTTSRYFNTTERVTALLVKVTNQIIQSCRLYINVNDTKSVWVQKKGEVIRKIQVSKDFFTIV